jgi:hypothetical protein
VLAVGALTLELQDQAELGAIMVDLEGAEERVVTVSRVEPEELEPEVL